MSGPTISSFKPLEKTDDYRIETASTTGGMLFNDPKEGDMIRRSVQYVLQRVGTQVLQGNMTFSGMSMPVHMNEPRSVLERITDDWAYAPLYLNAAAATTDPVQRIKLVAAFVVSGLHCIDTLAKPFNPILGSTYQATLGDGSPCYIEQTSHHPPVTHYTIRPENKSYLLAGFSGVHGGVVWGLDTALSSRRIGINVVEFADGSRIVYTFPTMLLRALLSELKCEFSGPFSIMYEEHGLVFDLLVNPPQPMRWSPFSVGTPSDYLDGVLYRISETKKEEGTVTFTGAFGKQEGSFFGNPDKALEEARDGGYTAIELRSDAEMTQSVTSVTQARGGAATGTQILRTQAGEVEREILSVARGTFVGYFDIDGERWWDIRETEKGSVGGGDMSQALASDCRYREDVIALRRALDESNDVGTRDAITGEAQILKEKLENIQRQDRKFRKEGVLEEDEAGDEEPQTENEAGPNFENGKKQVDECNA
ncbi:Oxysterol-binding protein [Gracilaria domingensis]|nr:Oxysterol-binding protein [Gracilaria domingensis]